MLQDTHSLAYNEISRMRIVVKTYNLIKNVIQHGSNDSAKALTYDLNNPRQEQVSKCYVGDKKDILAENRMKSDSSYTTNRQLTFYQWARHISQQNSNMST